MEVDDFPSLDPNVDYEKILPIHQKRMITFINHFLSNTVSFLNNFAQSCESRLMEFEYKMQKIEASLLILESQLSSISGLDEIGFEAKSKNTEQTTFDYSLSNVTLNNESDVTVAEDSLIVSSPKDLEDRQFARFFKMVQVGVPLQAVKNKMVIEGLDSSVLDKPKDLPQT